MSRRYLKYETEAENSMVDENGVLLPGGGMTIVEIDTLWIEDGAIYDLLCDKVRAGQPVCFFYNDHYMYPLCAQLNDYAGTEADDFSHRYCLEFYVYERTSSDANKTRVQIFKNV